MVCQCCMSGASCNNCGSLAATADLRKYTGCASKWPSCSSAGRCWCGTMTINRNSCCLSTIPRRQCYWPESSRPLLRSGYWRCWCPVMIFHLLTLWVHSCIVAMAVHTLYILLPVGGRCTGCFFVYSLVRLCLGFWGSTAHQSERLCGGKCVHACRVWVLALVLVGSLN